MNIYKNQLILLYLEIRTINLLLQYRLTSGIQGNTIKKFCILKFHIILHIIEYKLGPSQNVWIAVNSSPACAGKKIKKKKCPSFTLS